MLIDLLQISPKPSSRRSKNLSI